MPEFSAPVETTPHPERPTLSQRNNQMGGSRADICLSIAASLMRLGMVLRALLTL